ncbi:hypothetical protein QWZ13_19025 [Reinekea marina]|uniref:Uncharacterized protein n=1 Tax=Reinekea marina TaxID=1310421 RepID=A0ABV7WTP6_9GAMM|nr:hypothetical protein [Reinekea marina]MDN3651007.1 hypothetical protein [Reinekea marina]
MRLLVVLFLVFAGQFVFAATDYRPYILGEWQCQSSVHTQYGDTLAIGDLSINDNGHLLGSGNLLFFYPRLNTEVPLAASLKAKWTFVNNQLVVSQLSGDIISPYPLLNGVASSFKQDILQQKTVTFKLAKIGKKFMAFTAEDQTEIQCIRPLAE